MRVVPNLVAATLTLSLSRAVLGSLYVTNPAATTVCHGGQPCQVQWLDNGQAPLLTAIGPCYVSLYAGNEELIQQIEPVDVSTSDSLTFTPSPTAGPNSNTYYLQFTSVNTSNAANPFIAFSASFSLDRMSGSFQSPVPGLTSSIPVPSSVLTAHPNSISTTLLSGIISRSVSTFSSPSSLSSSDSSRSASTSLSPTNAPSKISNAAVQHPLRLSIVTLLGLSIFVLV